MNRLIVLLLCMVTLFSCVRKQAENETVNLSNTSQTDITVGTVAVEGSQESSAISYTPSPTFNGYPCTSDCSGHEAGYQWAEENSITDPNECSGNSNSFIEGCESYAEDNGVDDSESTNEDSEE